MSKSIRKTRANQSNIDDSQYFLDWVFFNPELSKLDCHILLRLHASSWGGVKIQSTIAKWCKATKGAVSKSVTRLIKQGYLIKNEDGIFVSRPSQKSFLQETSEPETNEKKFPTGNFSESKSFPEETKSFLAETPCYILNNNLTSIDQTPKSNDFEETSKKPKKRSKTKQEPSKVKKATPKKRIATEWPNPNAIASGPDPLGNVRTTCLNTRYVYFSEHEKQSLRDWCRSHGYPQEAIPIALEFLDDWAENNWKEFSKKVSHISCIRGWPMDKAIKRLTEKTWNEHASNKKALQP